MQVIPQFIARIQIKEEGIRVGIHDLLVRIGIVQPQAVLFPLTVAANNTEHNPLRFQAAQQILDKLQSRTPELVNEVRIDSTASPLNSYFGVLIFWRD